MKRITQKHKSEKIRADAMEQLRETRGVLNDKYPDLLNQMGQIVEKAKEDGTLDLPIDPPVQKTAPLPPSGSELTIDRQKNLETILKFIELKPHSDHLKQELKDILS
jgi:hypothetical protein